MNVQGAGQGPVAIICPSCSAPLKSGGSETVVQCHYCGATVSAAPKTYGFPQPIAFQQARPSVQFNNGANTSKNAIVGVLVALVVIGLLAVVAGAFAFHGARANGGPVRVEGVPGFSVSNVNGIRTVATLPVECGLNEHLTVSHAVFNGLGTAINAGTNCTLVIESSSIVATTAISATMNANITITDSVLTATGTAIDLGTNATLTVSGTSEIGSTASDAIVGALNPHIVLTGTKVHASGTAVKGSLNAKMFFEGADVRGATAIEGDENCNVHLSKKTNAIGTSVGVGCAFNAILAIEDSDVEGGKGTGIDLQSNANIVIASSTISGGHAAISTADRPKQEDISGTTLTGPNLAGGHVFLGRTRR